MDVKLNLQNNWLNIKKKKILPGELCKIVKDKIIRTVENIILN